MQHQQQQQQQHHSSDACGQSSKADPTDTSSTSYAETCTCCNAKNLDLHFTETSVNCVTGNCSQLGGYQHGYQHHQPTAPSAPAISSSSSYDMASSSSANQQHHHPHHNSHHHHSQQQQPSYLQHCPSTSFLKNPVATSSSAAFPGPRNSSFSSSSSAASNNASNNVAFSSSVSFRPVVEYVYELPYDVRREVCDLLDADGNWRKLGGIYMKFTDTQLTLFSHAFYRNESPTNQLLMKWESSNGKVSQLYRFLGDMNHRRAMQPLRPFVEEKWRLLFDDGDDCQHSPGGGGALPEQGFAPGDRQSFYPALHSLNSQQFQRQQSFTASNLPPGSTSFADHQQNSYNFQSGSAAGLQENLKRQQQQQLQHQQQLHQQQYKQQQQHPKHHVDFAGNSRVNFGSSNANQLLPTFTGSFTGKPNFAVGNQVNNNNFGVPTNAAPNFGDMMISQNRHFLHELPHHLRHAKTSFSGNSGDSSSGDHTLVDINSNSQMRAVSGSSNQQGGFSEAANRLKQEKLDYLVRIEDFEIPYKELAVATDDFCKDRILGSGGFGTVYIGEWKGTKVAVKKLKGLDNSAQAFTELRVLNCCRIDNILPLYAVALDGPEPCLVYQYMCNGSLEDRLLCKSGTTPLTWIQRAKIGEGVARALNFLHTLKGNPFVHGDVKSANILLDAVFEPKLGDFGLARKVEKRGGGQSKNDTSLYTHCTVSSVNGTSVYLPSEYLRNKMLSPAVDVYSYGIVILEMATGRRAYDGKRLLIHSVEDEYMSLVVASKAAVGGGQSNTKGEQSKQLAMPANTAGSSNSSGDEGGGGGLLLQVPPPQLSAAYSTSSPPSSSMAVSATLPTASTITSAANSSTTSNSASNASSTVHENLMDRRIVHLPDDRHWFNCLLELGRKCAHKIKSKRPLMVQVLEYFNQCKTTDRIHKLVDKRTVTANMLPFSCKSVLLKSPLELQLWYDFVRQSCGPHLSDVVFENFGAQVTRMIEDFNTSTAYSEAEKEPKQNDILKDNSTLKVKQKHPKKINICDKKLSNSKKSSQTNDVNANQIAQTGTGKSFLPELGPATTAAAVASSPPLDYQTLSQISSAVSVHSSSSTNSSSSLSPLHLPQLLQLMTMASFDDGGGSGSSTAISSASTIEDELSLFSGSDVDSSLSKVTATTSEHSTSDDADEGAQTDNAAQHQLKNSPVANENAILNKNKMETLSSVKNENSEVISSDENKIDEGENDYSMPFIPLLTALGFANEDIEDIVNNSGKLKQLNSSESIYND